MPVNNNYEIQEYQGNSSGRIYNFPFRCFSLDHLKVELIDSKGSVTELIRNTDYKVTGGLDNAGGMITYPLDASLKALSSSETIRIYRSTPMEQSIDYPTYQQAIENALDKVIMLLQETINTSAVNIANEAREKVNKALAIATTKTDTDGSNIDKYQFLTALGIGSNGELDLTDLCRTDGSNADAEAFQSLVGMPEVESSISEINDYLSGLVKTDGSNITVEEWRTLLGIKDTLAIAPQTIVKGAVGDIPSGWQEGWCDKPAQHLEVSTSGSSSLIVKSGLQVAAGVEGKVLLSNELESDTSLDISSALAQTNGTFYIYADLDTSGSMSFGYTENEPYVGLSNVKLSANILNPQDSNWTGSGVSWSNGNWVVVSNGHYSSLTVNNSSDGSTTTYWESAGAIPTWVYVGNTIESNIITQVKIYPYTAYNPKNFIIQGANEIGSWVDLVTVTNKTDWTVGTPSIFNLPENSDYNYIRIYITANTGGSAYTLINEIQLIGAQIDRSFYNTSNQTHYDKSGNSISRVYLGEVSIASGAVTHVLNYQHSTTVTMPVNGGSNIGTNSKYFLDKPYLGYCTSQVRIYHESKWGKTGGFGTDSNNGRGTLSNITEGKLSVQTGGSGIMSIGLYSGSEFSSTATSAIAKVTVQRGW